MTAIKTSYTTCPLCEASCGLEVVTREREILSIRGDANDVLSRGYLCPKAASLKELNTDPDRIREPMLRKGDQWMAVSWDEAFTEIEHGLAPLIQQHGRDAIALYVGNPNLHNLSSLLYLPLFYQALGSRQIFSSATVDGMPKWVAAGLMFGTPLSIPVPDVERTDYLLILGANPLVSNGSLMTAPDMRGRLRRLRQRGGKVVVIDPYRTHTAQEADEHHFIRPGCDAHFLFALIHILFAEERVAPGRLTEYLNDLEHIRQLALPFTPEKVASLCGIPVEAIRALARALVTAPRAVVYGRMGTCTQEFGTLASWLIDVLNILTGNLDREGGAMFPRAAAGARNTQGQSGSGKGVRIGRWKSRVQKLPEVFGELPVACLAEEIETPGEGQIKALITLAGNPALSIPSSQHIQRALGTLEYMVSFDLYRNETTRYANVILPPLSALARSHYAVVDYQVAIQNVAHYSPPVLEWEPGMLEEWEVLLRLADLLSGQGRQRDSHMLDDLAITAMVQREVATSGSPLHGRAVNEILEALTPRRGPERMLDFLLRSGPYGDGFDTQSAGLSLAALEKRPHGIDLGPLQPRLPEVLRTPSGKIELAPQLLVQDVKRLQASLEDVEKANGQIVLIGRRDLRSNNSWMHNLQMLTKGKERCLLHIHPIDATRLGFVDGEIASLTTRAGSVLVPIEVTDAIMPGVVSLPHGWGHHLPGIQMQIATRHAGVNANVLTDEANVDPLSGTAILNGVPVTLQKAG
ncbi:molybdopterin-binding oxidoreductase [Ktedonobacter sp. SOSP1-85]|uniref:molybdopterin oxidoreductase family protein n=1 Tax=Ktedonobacter sp. SOSP1-85 TaxID=2778367 RepID=UPI001916B55B|nr:molybdopterin oxidoreductase family protein [Ktedonobacter sp. SOSP1-85]GHO72367.1 molybdopterin-binding oxidoreductase [Ktedonobacter sp. SOSP1-85]